MRQIVLDTETTGLEPEQGHRIIEIGCVELIERRVTDNHFHVYLQPDREIDAGAIEVHGITNEFLADKPRFGDVADDFIAYVRDAELLIHNAPFDVGFLNAELAKLGQGQTVGDYCRVTDTLTMAREMHPGQRNSLDALCQRYEVDNSNRQLHGALLDSQILAEVYLAMTGGQVSLSLEAAPGSAGEIREFQFFNPPGQRPALRVVKAAAAELAAHQTRLDAIEKSAGSCVWRQDG